MCYGYSALLITVALGMVRRFTGRVCSWRAVEGRFCAIAAGEAGTSGEIVAAFAAGGRCKGDFVQSRQGKGAAGQGTGTILDLSQRIFIFA